MAPEPTVISTEQATDHYLGLEVLITEWSDGYRTAAFRPVGRNSWSASVPLRQVES